MFTISPQTSDNRTPRGAASLMKTQELLSRPAVSLCQKHASFIHTSKSICTKRKSQIICSKHTMRHYFSISFFGEGEKSSLKKKKKNIQMPFIFFFKGGIRKYNPVFEDISDQHMEGDIYNMIRGSLTVPWHIVITNRDGFYFLYAD